MLSLFISIISIFITIIFVVGTHEFAHFIVAKMLGVKVLRFSIGFGKPLFRHIGKSGTEYIFALIPLGGYVKMLDELEGKVPKEELHLAFNRQPYYKKFLIVVAGPLMNLLCAVFLYWLIFIIGFVAIKPIIGNVAPNSIAAQAGLKANQEIVAIDHHPTRTWTSVILRLLRHAGNEDTVTIEVKNLANKNANTQITDSHTLELSNWSLEGLNPDPLQSLGIKPFEPSIPLKIDVIAKKSPAEGSLLRVGDVITAVNQQSIQNWEELMSIISQHPDQTLDFTVNRAGKALTVPVMLGHHTSILMHKTGYLGIGPIFEPPATLIQTIQFSPLAAIPHAFQEIWNFTYFNVMIFGKMLTGKISYQSLGGPVTIFETAGKALNYGLIAFLGFLAFLSVALGVINLLPVPGLDGGHILLYTIEAIIRRPLPLNVLVLLYRLGFLLIFLLIFQAIINDISRLFY